jgi:hypothetical protein
VVATCGQVVDYIPIIAWRPSDTASRLPSAAQSVTTLSPIVFEAR